jgi:hypothetical protein
MIITLRVERGKARKIRKPRNVRVFIKKVGSLGLVRSKKERDNSVNLKCYADSEGLLVG